MMTRKKPEDEKGKPGYMPTSTSTSSIDAQQPPQPTLPSTTTATLTTTTTSTATKDSKEKAGAADTISAVRGGVLKNGIYYSESELAEQSAITWNPCYWTKERISKWVDEVENPDTLKTIAKSLSPTNGASS